MIFNNRISIEVNLKEKTIHFFHQEKNKIEVVQQAVGYKNCPPPPLAYYV
jgi:hypothetical protein